MNKVKTVTLLQTSKIEPLSTPIAIGSFAIGTLFLMMYRMFPEASDVIVMTGIIYVLLALISNSLLFFYLFYHFVIHKSQRNHLVGKRLIMLSNIPIAILYLYLIIINFNL